MLHLFFLIIIKQYLMANTATTLSGFIGLTALFIFYILFGSKGFIIAGVLFAIIVALIYLNQDMLLYVPGTLIFNLVVPGLSIKSPSQNPIGSRNPLERDLEYADLNLNTSDGVIIRGWHVKSKKIA